MTLCTSARVVARRVPRASVCKRVGGNTHGGCVAHAETNKTENYNCGVRRRFVAFLRPRRKQEQTLLTESLVRIVCIYLAYFYDIYFPPRRYDAPVSHSQLFARRFSWQEKERKRERIVKGAREDEKGATDIKRRSMIKRKSVSLSFSYDQM